MTRLLALALVVLVALTALGCRPKNTGEEGASASRVEYFKQKQAATVMSHGKINLDTVEETAGGKIKYQTEDGRTWVVDMKPDSKGGYSYGTPQAVH
jgi:hypothetical protein